MAGKLFEMQISTFTSLSLYTFISFAQGSGSLSSLLWFCGLLAWTDPYVQFADLEGY